MTRAITQSQFLAAPSEALAAVGEDSFIIRDGEKFVAALVSEQEFDETRRARGRRAIAAMNRISDAIEASRATEEELKELEKALDRHL